MKDQWMAGLLLLVAASLAASAAHAGDVNDIGKTVRKQLEIQAGGRQAVATRPILKDVADRTYERYLQSFKYPIPEQFDRNESFTTDGGG